MKGVRSYQFPVINKPPFYRAELGLDHRSLLPSTTATATTWDLPGSKSSTYGLEDPRAIAFSLPSQFRVRNSKGRTSSPSHSAWWPRAVGSCMIRGFRTSKPPLVG